MLLTGATGQIGRLVLCRWLKTGHKAVITLRKPERQWPRLRDWLESQDVSSARVDCVKTDFALADFGWDERARAGVCTATCVVHLAAMWGWGLDWAQADAVNVRASLRLHRWASDIGMHGPFICAGGFLTQVPGYLGRLALHERDVDWARAAKRWGTYEMTKFKSYLTMRPPHTRPKDMPITWIHPATVIGDARAPGIPDHAAIAGILRSIRRSMLRFVPGAATDLVPWVTGRYVSDYIVALLLSADDGVTDHLLLDPHSPSLRDTVALMSKAIGKAEPIGHVPIGWMRGLLKLPVVPDLVGVSAESLNFIVTAAPDATASVRWGMRHDVMHPDIGESLVATAQHWNEHGPAF